MKNKTSKSAKLRDFICVICGEPFQNYLSPSDIKAGRGKVCSNKCKRELSYINNKRGEDRKCARCGKMFHVVPSMDAKTPNGRQYCSRKCYHPVERGKSMSTDGYYIINLKKVHRIVMEEHIGRKLLPTEIVHHINNNKLDNRIENLQIVTRSEHNKIHKFIKND